MSIHADNRRLVRRLVLGAVLMFGFGFALVPLYDVFCEVTGLNGKITNTGPVVVDGPDRSRQVKVRLIAVHNEGMPWTFDPTDNVIETHPGEMKQTSFRAANPTGRRMVAQAIPSVAPAEAAQYLHKVNCFCFEQQALLAGESIEMPLLFVIDKKLPEHIRSLTLSYTLFDISPEVSTAAMAEKEQSL
ncbi:cytochrome c oxidase assembly protein [Marinobacterium sediminicola]|uniref:Cytochrome c oxidase assembly protein CtaG n=1 Tax=Marinobacterium sediminicola TaxID=518898 RepID=A0ABY1S473_9GAMM|nr:cytochrome c oxidase assembly protein [Marinobacterium sediminicola]ULG68930.1 cytochrome c oxidase assembly protein [Marinobacterium sediminicola]SMR78433.1 cytochrome c oxidase assembly protein subunit 11 [Marinobacterium sediminicola]